MQALGGFELIHLISSSLSVLSHRYFLFCSAFFCSPYQPKLARRSPRHSPFPVTMASTAAAQHHSPPPPPPTHRQQHNSMQEQEDEDVRIAARALDDMRNSSRASSAMAASTEAPASSTSPPPSSPSTAVAGDSRWVTTLPLVTTALRAYEQGKASSRVVRYGAGVVEYVGSQATSYLQPREKDEIASPTTTVAGEDDEQHKLPLSPTSPSDDPQQQRQLSAPRSRWQTVLLEAGGLSAALSDDNLKRLRYCLQCLQVRRGLLIPYDND